jgi:hypothetical protein
VVDSPHIESPRKVPRFDPGPKHFLLFAAPGQTGFFFSNGRRALALVALVSAVHRYIQKTEGLSNAKPGERICLPRRCQIEASGLDAGGSVSGYLTVSELARGLPSRDPSVNQPAPLSICRVFEVKVTSVSFQNPFATFEVAVSNQ